MSGAEGPQFLDLDAGSEWRFELENDENIAVRADPSESVYINSEEIPPSTWYPLHRNLKAAVYAPQATTIEVSSLPASQYTSTSTNQPALISLQLALERLRILARRHLNPSATNGHSTSDPTRLFTPGDEVVDHGGRVMVIGPPCSGKTTVVKNLVNMALGSGLGWTPGVIGLDPASPANLIPGSFSLSMPTIPLPTHSPAHPLGAPPISVPANTLGADVSTIGWWYGHIEPTNKGVDIWKKLVASIGAKWRDRCDKDPMAIASGTFVDTPSAFTNALLGTRKENLRDRYSLVSHAVEHLQIDTIIVIGHEKLTIDLTRLFPSVRVLRLPRSSGTVDVDDQYRAVVQTAQVRGYFYGEPSLSNEIESLPGKIVAREGRLNPYSFQIGWETLTILRVGEENAAPSTALPLGSTHILSPTRLTKVDPSGPSHVTRLLNAVLAIVQIVPEDRLKPAGKSTEKETVKDEIKAEGEDVKPSEPVETEEGEVEAQEEKEPEEDDEVPFREEIGWREVLGFIVITGIDTQRRKYTVLSPSPGKLPSTVAIAGSLEWVDSE